MSAKSLKGMPSTTILKSSKSSQNNKVLSCIISKRSTKCDKPSPLEFDKFLPWVCLQFEIFVEIAVIKAVIDKHITSRKLSHSSRTRSSEMKQSQLLAESSKKPDYLTQGSPISASDLLDKILITAFYNNSGHLAEIALIKSPVAIHRKVIKAINICLPFHPTLFKLTIRSSLTPSVLYEIAKLLPHSNITDICLDDSFIPEGNYFILLDQISSLKVLSLKRCNIVDVILKEITERMDLGRTGAALTVLDLGSNKITDTGVGYLADVLRRNRSLIHLNLSSNMITDCGLNYIMNHLMEFPMTPEEIFDKRMRRLKLIKRNGLSIEHHKDKANDDTADQGTQVNFRSGKGKQKSGKKKKHSVALSNVDTDIKRETFVDVFDDNNIVIRDGYTYCIGNFTLCSLNLAYNELEYFSLVRILDVLHYQIRFRNSSHRTGLMRLVLDGNLLPQNCEEMYEIRMLLQPVVPNSSQSHPTLQSRSRAESTLRK